MTGARSDEAEAYSDSGTSVCRIVNIWSSQLKNVKSPGVEAETTHVELVEVDDWAPEEVVVLVEVSHTDWKSRNERNN